MHHQLLEWNAVPLSRRLPQPPWHDKVARSRGAEMTSVHSCVRLLWGGAAVGKAKRSGGGEGLGNEVAFGC